MIGPLTPEAIEAAAEAGWAKFHEVLRLSNPGMPPKRPWEREDDPVRAIYRAMVVAAHAALTAFAVVDRPAAVERAAAAIANARGMRRGAPTITNIMEILPDNLAAEVREDAEEALKAALAGEVRT